jgi:hypothetical protein
MRPLESIMASSDLGKARNLGSFSNGSGRGLSSQGVVVEGCEAASVLDLDRANGRFREAASAVLGRGEGG